MAERPQGATSVPDRATPTRKQAIIFRAVWRQPRGGGFPPPKLLGAHPLGEGARVMGAIGSPCRSGRISGDSPPAQDCRGYRLRPWEGRRGDCQLAIYLLAICCLFLTIVIYMLYNIFLGGFVMLSNCPIVLLLGYQFSIYP